MRQLSAIEANVICTSRSTKELSTTSRLQSEQKVVSTTIKKKQILILLGITCLQANVTNSSANMKKHSLTTKSEYRRRSSPKFIIIEGLRRCRSPNLKKGLKISKKRSDSARNKKKTMLNSNTKLT